MVNCGDILLVTLLFCAVLTWGGTCQVFEIFSDEKVRISFLPFWIPLSFPPEFFSNFPMFSVGVHVNSVSLHVTLS